MSARADRYRIRGPIGKGSVAEVFDAEMSGDQGFVRRVAIKRLLPEAAAEEQFVRAFIDEGRILGALHHPNICSVFDLGSMNGLPFLVLEHVDGKNGEELASFVERELGQMPLEVALFITCEIGRALDYAHAATDANGDPLYIVHRDVNPKNVLISWRGDVKLTDFGIARAEKRLENTRAGVVKGTLAYMAPEQITGKDVDRRADIFSLGCTLHRLLAQKSPFADPDVRRDFLVTGRIPIEPKLPEKVVALLDRAMRPNREQRYSTAAEMVAEADAILRASTSQDPRALMRDFMLRVRPTLAKPPKHRVADLFDIQLIGVDASVAEPVRRFQTIARGQSGPELASESTTQGTPKAAKPVTVHEVAPAAAEKDPMIGRSVHGYELVEFLGQGAWANVYRGKHKILDMECAIKILRGDRNDPVQAKRIHREAKIAGKLQHKNLLRVLDCGELEGGAPFLTMELLRGEMFGEILWKEAPLDIPRTVDLLRQLALGLSEAHRHGLVHRDLKPTNIMLVVEDGEEVPKILDFGIAMAIDPEIPMTRLTGHKALLGTPRYMAPEQIISASSVEQSADIYALGGILYIMLTGRPQFTGTVDELLEQHLHADPVPPPHAHGLGPLAMQMLDKDAGARPTAEQLIESLDQLELTRVTEIDRPGSRTFAPPIVDTKIVDTKIVERDTRLRHSSSRRSTQRVWMWGALIGAVAALSFAALKLSEPPVRVIVEVAPPAGVARPGIVARADEKPAIVEVPAIEEQEETAPVEPKKAAVPKRPVPSASELEKKIAVALARRGLSAVDVADLPALEAPLADFNADKSEAKANELIAAIESAELDQAVVKRKLERANLALERAAASRSAEEIREMEAQYFGLRERLKKSLSNAEAEALIKDVAAFEQRIRSFTGSAGRTER